MKYFRDLKYVMKIQLIRMSGMLIFYAFIQIFMALGIIVGFKYMFATPEGNNLLYLATGAPTYIIIMTGLVGVPLEIGKAKTAGYVDFTRTWPIKQSVILLSDTIIWLAVMIPAITVSTTIAHLFIQPGYSLSFTIIPGFFLSGITSIGVGYGISYLLKEEQAQMISQVIAFGALMFSPLNFPIDRLPNWLQAVHEVLPIHSMTQIMRSSMASATFQATTANYINLTVWCVLGFVGATYILKKKN